MMKKRSILAVCLLLPIFSLCSYSIGNEPVTETLDFPTTGLLPKKEIGALDFLKDHPNADGRGIIVAVLDTGVDPGAPGLQKTTTGAPKIIAVIDATGSGDVPTTSIVKLSKDGTITGLSGRTLKVNKKWKNPSGEFHLGLVAGYDLFPEELVARLEKERAEDWMAEQRMLERKLQSEIEAYQKKFESPNSKQKETLADLEERLAVAKSFKESYKDPGPIYDCIVFNDGKLWRAVIDTDTDSDLSDELVLANFDEEQVYGTFGDDSLLNFAVNIYNEGELLSIVADTGMHGTHVAGIVGAYFEEQPELNGVAPGAQIVSIKIGDTRLGGMETPHALSRAVLAIKKFNCDMVNMSYGEATRFPESGNVVERLSSLVDDDNVVYISSAGNSGPALTTVGAPGGTTSSIIGVGATITPELMKTSYSLLKDLPANQFTWSSRGPTIDGDLGVDISAPGGAISPVPRWELSKNMRANGTSMAGPDACGGIALVLSALKQEDKAYTSSWVKRAIQHTGKIIPNVDVFGQGYGMLQVEATYEMLAALPENQLVTPRYEVLVDGNKRGIYLRNGDLTPATQTFGMSVKPKFPENTDKEIEADFEARYVLKTEADWVKAPEFVFVNSLNKRFDIQVDTSDLTPGVHYTEVVAIDASYSPAGPAFRIPVTVVKPTELHSNEWESTETFTPGEIKRFFFQVPAGATWASLNIEAPDVSETTTFVVHPQHVIPGERYVNVGDSYYLGVSQNNPKEQSFQVIEGATMELALAQYWQEITAGSYELKLRFHGLTAEHGDGIYAQGDGAEEFRVLSFVEKSRLNPNASFSHLRTSVAPSSAVLSVLTDDRDQIEKDGEAYHQIIFEYPFQLEDTSNVTPIFSTLNDKIYEVEFESQLQMIFDINKQLVATEDTFPNPVKLSEGNYTLRLQLRHKERSALEELKSLNLSLDIELASPISVETYASTDQALRASGSDGSRTLYPHTRTPLVVIEPKASDLPAFAKPGDVLVGSLTLQSGSNHTIPLNWIYNGKTLSEEVQESENNSEETTLEEDVTGALVELASKYRKDENKELFDALMKEHLSNSPKQIEVALEKLRWWTDSDEKGESTSNIYDAADSVISLIDAEKLAQYFGVNHDSSDTEAKKLSKQMNKQKDALIEALSAKTKAACKSSKELSEIETYYAQLKKWVEVSHIDSKIKEAVFKKQDRWGKTLSLMNEEIEDDISDKERYQERIEIMKSLNWDHLVTYEKQWMVRRFPTDYAKF